MKTQDHIVPTTPTDEWIADVRDAMLKWGAAHSQSYPWRAPNLPVWQGLIAEFLLLRTRADQAASVFENIQRQLPDARLLGENPRRLLERNDRVAWSSVATAFVHSAGPCDR